MRSANRPLSACGAFGKNTIAMLGLFELPAEPVFVPIRPVVGSEERVVAYVLREHDADAVLNEILEDRTSGTGSRPSSARGSSTGPT